MRIVKLNMSAGGLNMVTTVCLNPCIDKTVKIESLKIGGLNRIIETFIDGSGKGVNVAIASQQLDVDATCIGLLYRKNGDIIYNRLRENNVCVDFHWSEGEVRTNLKISDQNSGIVTEINEKGIAMSDEQIMYIREKVRGYAGKSEIIVFTGSLPPGCPTDFYQKLMQEVADYPVKCILDAEGEILLKGICAKPFLIKPNDYELRMATGLPLHSPKDFLQAALLFIKEGAKIVAVSMGGNGAIVTNGQEAYFAPVISVCVKSTVGAGDSMVAGFCKAIEMQLPLCEMFRYGVAAATASVMTEGTQLIDRDKFERLLNMVILEKLM